MVLYDNTTCLVIQNVSMRDKWQCDTMFYFKIVLYDNKNMS
jgi:hypothetical protein